MRNPGIKNKAASVLGRVTIIHTIDFISCTVLVLRITPAGQMACRTYLWFSHEY